MSSASESEQNERDTDLVALEDGEQELASLEAELEAVDGAGSDERQAEQR